MGAKTELIKKIITKADQMNVENIVNVVGGLTRKTAGATSEFDRELTGLGKIILGGAIAAGTVNSAADAYNNSSIGYSDGTIRKATPSIRPYIPQNNGQQDISSGATGDLVFAMHKNRNSGYL